WDRGVGGWRRWRKRLLTWEEEEVKEYTALTANVCLTVDVDDKWRWPL
ncbi:YIPF1-like protein, partial [Trifolium medium]|nr:YIPF1-like protein [Trifolium medium]